MIFPLTAQVVHIWLCPLELRVAQQALGLLDAAEHAQAERFHFERHRRAFVAARGWRRLLLSHYAQRPAAALAFKANPQGKPALAAAAGLEFNVSHSEGWMLLAVARDYPVGIDIEAWREVAVHDLARTAFSPLEQATLAALPVVQQLAAFFQIWASKEAFIKALGLGLSHPLDSFDTEGNPGQAPRLLATRPAPADAAGWRLHGLAAPAGYSAVLCCAPAAQPLHCGVADWNALAANQ